MKSSDIITAYAVLNNCYKANKPLKPMGIVVHSTGANNPRLSRYVDAPAYVGVNNMCNHWNTPKPGGRDVCVHAFIGLDIRNEVKVAQILPYTMQAWAVGNGRKGTYNKTHIHFEVCEDSLSDKGYFEKAISAAIEYCAYLCHEFRLDPITVVSHAEAHAAGYGSNHGDIDHWLRRYGWTMSMFRGEVSRVYKQLYNIPLDPVAEIKRICGFTDETIAYMRNYKYSGELFQKIYDNLKGE